MSREPFEAMPDVMDAKQLEHIVTYDVVILVCPQNLIGTAGQFIGGFPFLRKLSG